MVVYAVLLSSRVIYLSLLNFTALLLVQSSNLARSPWTGALPSSVSIAYMYFTEWECAWKTELYCGGKKRGTTLTKAANALAF